jgi:hypothetical protein
LPTLTLPNLLKDLSGTGDQFKPDAGWTLYCLLSFDEGIPTTQDNAIKRAIELSIKLIEYFQANECTSKLSICHSKFSITKLLTGLEKSAGQFYSGFQVKKPFKTGFVMEKCSCL